MKRCPGEPDNPCDYANACRFHGDREACKAAYGYDKPPVVVGKTLTPRGWQNDVQYPEKGADDGS